MLFRLVPSTPLPTILFTIAFNSFPDTLPLPPAWSAHLALLAAARLPAPPSLHALDPACASTALLDTVTFDLAKLTVTCVFVDGAVQEWLLAARCAEILDGVVRDVDRSAAEADAEHGRMRPCASPPPLPKPRKRRSILSLISALVSFVPPAKAHEYPPSPAPSPPLEALLTHGVPASRFLRRRARSTLVNVYRRYVLPELRARLGIPQYALWAARSTLARVEAEMERGVGEGEECETESATTGTDGSSVHTPLDSHDVPQPHVKALARSTGTSYHNLLDTHHALRTIIHHLTQLQDDAEEERKKLEEEGAARSRRKCFSQGLGRKSVMAVGLAVPLKGSPLRWGWSAEEVQEGCGEREARTGRSEAEGVGADGWGGCGDARRDVLHVRVYEVHEDADADEHARLDEADHNAYLYAHHAPQEFLLHAPAPASCTPPLNSPSSTSSLSWTPPKPRVPRRRTVSLSLPRSASTSMPPTHPRRISYPTALPDPKTTYLPIGVCASVPVAVATVARQGVLPGLGRNVLVPKMLPKGVSVPIALPRGVPVSVSPPTCMTQPSIGKLPLSAHPIVEGHECGAVHDGFRCGRMWDVEACGVAV
ncbi:hypothetical protein K439DRAFT_676987 [Ramaria rubella]|nr:hypothetical protein K439DRAFT_676987 [Ramaria rubella]